MLKVKDLPKSMRQKSEIAARDERAPGDDGRDVLSVFRTRYSAHLREIAVTTVVKTSVPDVRLSIPAVSCVVTSVSAGKLRSIFIK